MEKHCGDIGVGFAESQCPVASLSKVEELRGDVGHPRSAPTIARHVAYRLNELTIVVNIEVGEVVPLSALGPRCRLGLTLKAAVQLEVGFEGVVLLHHVRVGEGDVERGGSGNDGVIVPHSEMCPRVVKLLSEVVSVVPVGGCSGHDAPRRVRHAATPPHLALAIDHHNRGGAFVWSNRYGHARRVDRLHESLAGGMVHHDDRQIHIIARPTHHILVAKVL
mmetsp:Transcript_66266/g.156496  ORF Transcript_66266/g.156496 Transcript_66266/m.156496 type:complete len:221 (-) Transcript_66266:818-1480(-)